MKEWNLFVARRAALNRLGAVICLFLLLWLAWPGLALADGPSDSSPCLGCHTVEVAAWSQSRHAQANQEGQHVGATCEDCHGPYVDNHGQQGGMTLLSNSQMCQGCHEHTFGQWQTSRHRATGVQCIGCHQPHSQELRLTDVSLCESCHRDQVEDLFHSAHLSTEAVCTTCHMAPTAQSDSSLVSAGGGLAPNLASSHDFITVSASRCVNCHREDVGTTASTFDARQASMKDRLAVADSEIKQLTSGLEAARETNKFLRSLTLTGLGLGISVGVMIGVTLLAVVGYLTQRSRSR